MSRTPGYYWIWDTDNPDDPFIAEWTSFSEWLVMGSDEPVGDDDFVIVFGPISHPKPDDKPRR